MKIRPVILVLLLLLGSIFLFTQITLAVESNIVINEICPRGCASKKERQWLEIYNKSSQAVDISGWKFIVEGESEHRLTTTTLSNDFIVEAGEYAVIVYDEAEFLLANPGFIGKLFDSTWTRSLAQEGDRIGLKDNSGNWVEEIFLYLAVSNTSIQRKDANQSVSEIENWVAHPTGNSAGMINYWLEEEEPEEPEEPTPTSTPAITGLVINEFYPNSATSTENEWIEIYNLSTSSIDFTGWELWDGVKARNFPTGTVLAGDFFVIEFTNILNDSGDIIILKNPVGEIVDQVCYGNWEKDCVESAVARPAKGNSLARSIDGVGEFIETTNLTPGAINNIVSPPGTTPPSGGGSSTPAPVISYNPGDVVINELVSDPGDGQEEFIELFNKTTQNINLNSWWVEDGSETKTNLSGTITPQGFFVIEKPKGILNNAGDMVILFSPSGQEIDSVTYGSWDDGNLADNAPRANDPYSLARKIDGQDSDNDYYDFVVTATITKGKSNIITSLNIDGEKIEQVLVTSKIIINEIYPNPPGPDTEDEFIELYNSGLETVDLKDWLLSDATARKYKITSGLIRPGEYLVFKRLQTGIALNNTGGDEVKLYLPNGNLIANVKYTDKAIEGQAYARQDDGSFAWTTSPTPGLKNIIEGKSAEPIVVIEAETEVAVGEQVLFDASDTISPGGKAMKFTWDFGDKNKAEGISTKHSFKKAGVYTVKLTVTDSDKNKVEKKIIITVKDPKDFVGGYLVDEKLALIKISEFLPNPVGSDEAEFIELFNSSAEDIDLSGLKLDDEEGGSRAYTIPAGTIIGAGQYLVFGKQETKLALNNTSDAVRLLYPDGTVITEVYYENVPEGASYVQDEDDNWVWTSLPTPGEPNIILPVNNFSQKTSSRDKYEKPVYYLPLDKLRSLDIGDQVETQGLVAVAPGILSTQYFYLVNFSEEPTAGVQVYMHKKDWPILRPGDKLGIVGEISQAYGEIRVKLSERNSIQIFGQTEPPLGTTIKIEEIGEAWEGALLLVEGEITEIKASYMYVDDGTEEVKVYFKTGANINKKNFQLGDIVRVTGLLGQTNSGYQLLPRATADIVKIGVSQETMERLESFNNKDKSFAETYLTVTAGGLTSILLGLGARARGRFVFGVLKKVGKVAVSAFWRGPKV